MSEIKFAANENLNNSKRTLNEMIGGNDTPFYHSFGKFVQSEYFQKFEVVE
jgi:hypothetical protein